MLLNTLIWLQVKDKLNSSTSNTNSMEIKFSSLYDSLKSSEKHCYTIALLENVLPRLSGIATINRWYSNWRSWFLVVEIEKGIEFFDSKDKNIKKSINHFWSTNLKKGEEWVLAGLSRWQAFFDTCIWYLCR